MTAGPGGHEFGELDAHLMREGKHPKLYEKLGAHPTATGTHFTAWAPNAVAVSVIGDFNRWEPGANPLTPIGDTGVWQGSVDGVHKGALYKLHIRNEVTLYEVAKADPYALRHQTAPGTASVVWTLDYAWRDAEWMAKRAARNARTAPISIYEVHLGSWMRVPEDNNRSLSYAEITPQNPARPGETILLYLTGLGDVDPPVADGVPVPSGVFTNAVTQPLVVVDGEQVTPLFAGLTPTVVALYAIVVKIPPNIAPGNVYVDISLPDSYTTEAQIPIGISSLRDQPPGDRTVLPNPTWERPQKRLPGTRRRSPER